MTNERSWYPVERNKDFLEVKFHYDMVVCEIHYGGFVAETITMGEMLNDPSPRDLVARKVKGVANRTIAKRFVEKLREIKEADM